MISIKKYLGGDETTETLIRVLRLLLQGMGLHVVEGDIADRTRLRTALEQASTTLDEATAPNQYLVEAGIVIQALQDYTCRTTQVIQQSRTELHSMVSMLATTVQAVAADTGDSVSRLQEVEEQLASASQIEDMRFLRLKLNDCLHSIREETTKQRQQQERAIEALRAQKNTPAATEVRSGNKDTVTGLSDRGFAESEINEAIRAQRKAYAAVMVLDRVRSYNTAFGYQVGDQVLKHFAEFIGGKLRPGCQLFRWTGPALLLLIDRATREEAVREELSALMAQHFEHHVQTATRSIHLPVKCRWTLLPMMAAPRLLLQRIDNFIGAPQSAEL